MKAPAAGGAGSDAAGRAHAGTEGSGSAASAGAAWADALQAAALLAVDPCGIGGVWLRGAAGPARQAWLAALQAWLPPDAPLRRVPLNIADERLLGGLDLSATLQAGRPVVQRGLLAEADGGVLLLAMAERVTAATAARLAQAMDNHEVALQRDGLALRSPARWGLVALDEGIADDEGLPAALAERLGLVLDLDELPSRAWPQRDTASLAPWSRDVVAAARERLARVKVPGAVLESLCGAAFQLGVASVRASWMALQVARACAALRGADDANDDDAARAAALVLGPRATQLGAAAAPDSSPAEPPPGSAQASPRPNPPPPAAPDAEAAADPPPDGDPPPREPAPGDAPAADRSEPDPGSSHRSPSPDAVLEAARAAIPAGLLSRLQTASGAGRARSAPGRSGLAQHSLRRGRPCGTRRGEPRGGQRLSVIDTLRAAAPWQRLRRAPSAAAGDTAASTAATSAATTAAASVVAVAAENTPAAMSARVARIQVRREDFHVSRFKQRSITTTVFVVDASGSSALHRLAEAKGAVELLLADCYVRRDRVAVIAFRGSGAELLLPPTRSLVRAKRSLAGLPGGGGTPLAAGIAMASALAESLLRRGETPTLVLLTDGRANIARDGSPGRARATEEALAAARQARAAGIATLLLDTAPQPQPQARALGVALGATYLPMPHAGAAEVSRAVRATLATTPSTSAP